MKHKILVVDDERGICEILDRFLTRKGYEVITALNGETALKKVKNDKPNIVLLDIRMPNMNGVDVLKEIRKIDKELAVVMVTADTDEQVGKMCVELGAYDYITKPLGLEYLESVLMVKLLDCKK